VKYRMKKPSLLVFTILFNLVVFGQTKLIVDSKSAGGFCNNYFDLGEYGFALIFNKQNDVIDGAGQIQNIQYYSKDLTKRANFKLTTNGALQLYGTSTHIIVQERENTLYTMRLFDYLGKEVGKKKFDIANVGLRNEMIEKVHFTSKAEMLFEVYDGQGDLHLFKSNLAGTDDGQLQEVDLARPSAEPLKNMNYVGRWQFLGTVMGYYITARKGANAEFDPNAIAYHLAFYDEDFQLFKELLLDNFLLAGSQMLGKEASLSINSTLKSFVVSCMIKRNGNPGFMIANYGLGGGESSVMTRFWHKEYALKENEKYRLIENDGVSVPLPPSITHKGPQIILSIAKNRYNIDEETTNQLVVFDAQGNDKFNAIQMGNFEMLNFDNYCVDNNNMYSRIKALQMAAVLKPFCEMQNVDVLDIDLDAAGNELAIVRNYDVKKNQVTIFRFTKK